MNTIQIGDMGYIRCHRCEYICVVVGSYISRVKIRYRLAGGERRERIVNVTHDYSEFISVSNLYFPGFDALAQGMKRHLNVAENYV